MTNFTDVGYFAIISLFISNFVMKYADTILLHLFEYIIYPFGYMITYSNDDNETRDFDYIDNFITFYTLNYISTNEIQHFRICS